MKKRMKENEMKRYEDRSEVVMRGGDVVLKDMRRISQRRDSILILDLFSKNDVILFDRYDWSN